MPHYIVKIGNRYCEWSTATDCPVTSLVTLQEFRRWYHKKYGDSGMRDFADRIKRADKTGTSAIGWTLQEILATNRAGPDETHITVEEIQDRYCRPKLKARKRGEK